MRQYNAGVLTGMLLMVFATQGHWLITPKRHPGASTLQYAGAIGLMVATLAVALWLRSRHREG